MDERAFSIPFFRSNRTDREAPQSEPGPTANWADWLTQLKALPPEAGEWPEANTFIDAVQRIARQKHNQIEHQCKLQQALIEVATQCAESLLYFGIAAMKDLPPRKALLELEGQITRIYEQLSQIFDAAAISQAASPQSSSAGKEDKRVANGAFSATKDLASPPLSPSATQSAAETVPSERMSTPVHTAKASAETLSVLDTAARQYNPLTYTQERSLAVMRSGVGLVFASRALGLSHIIEANIDMFCRPICRTERKSPEQRSLHRFQLASICNNGSYSIVRNIALINA